MVTISNHTTTKNTNQHQSNKNVEDALENYLTNGDNFTGLKVPFGLGGYILCYTLKQTKKENLIFFHLGLAL